MKKWILFVVLAIVFYYGFEYLNWHPSWFELKVETSLSEEVFFNLYIDFFPIVAAAFIAFLPYKQIIRKNGLLVTSKSEN